MNEFEVIQAILKGDVNRYEEIVREYQSVVTNLCYKLCGTKLDVEELTQQVFIALYEALPRFKFQSKLSTFIYRITINVVYRQLRHHKKMVSYADVVKENDASPDLNAEQHIEHDEQINRLHWAIGQLKYEQRTALVLCVFKDFSYQDVADVMQCSLTKVESLIFRAKKNLKVLMDYGTK
ncbi:MAG: sigma-70 family RNA polymerase sigma factor [Bacteroidales bacterium]|nr:sigma-70 family RNA polymerase sigma factor [Candidatus Colimorpha onthohippi]